MLVMHPTYPPAASTKTIQIVGLRHSSDGNYGRTMRPTPVWLTVDEVADRLSLPLAEVYEAITADRLPAQPHDRSYLVRRTDVEAYLSANTVPTG
jgi:excisionase family DNA binding protein